MRVVAKRYAAALFELAKERGQLDNVQQEIELVAKSMQENDTFAEFLHHPRLSAAEKKQALLNVFGAHLSEISENFIKLLIDKGRQALLPFVVGEYAELANESRGLSVGEVVTAVDLTDTDRSRLEKQFSALVGKEVRLQNEVKPEMKGGVLVRIADRVYDGSVAGKLARFRKQLQQTQV